MFRSLFCIILMLTLSSCMLFQIRKPDIEQGNVITQEMVSRLRVGMTEMQVKNIMGNAILTNIFSPNRIDYVYTFESGLGGPRHEKRLNLIFYRGRLSEIHVSWS